MRYFTFVLTASVLVPLNGLIAQQPPVQIGQRARIHYNCSARVLLSGQTRTVCRTETGRLVSIRSDTLQLEQDRPDSLLTLPLPLVDRVDIWNRRSHGGAGIGVGFLLGALSGAALGAASESNDDWQGLAALVGAGVGALSGMLVGGIAGSLIKTSQWEEVPLDELRVSFAPQRHGHFAFGVSLRL